MRSKHMRQMFCYNRYLTRAVKYLQGTRHETDYCRLPTRVALTCCIMEDRNSGASENGGLAP